MANEITNVLQLSGNKERIVEILRRIKNDAYGPGTISFAKYIPMPKSLYMGNISEPVREKFGTHNWYDWRIRHWGTKWDAYGFSRFDINPDGEQLLFITAGSAPHVAIKKLSELYPDVCINHKWADDNLGYNCGMRQYYDGQKVSEYYPAEGKESIDYAIEFLGIDVVERGRCLNAKGDEYICLDDEEYELVEFMGKAALFSPYCISDKRRPEILHYYQIKEKAGFSGCVLIKEQLPFEEGELILITEEDGPWFMDRLLTCGEYLQDSFTFCSSLASEIQTGGMNL